MHRFGFRQPGGDDRTDEYVADETPRLLAPPPRLYVLTEAIADQYLHQFDRLCEMARRLCLSTGVDYSYGLVPVEGFWHNPHHPVFDPDIKGEWQCTIGICISRIVDETVGEMTVRHSQDLALQAGEEVRPIGFGSVVQALHRGPYNNVGATIRTIGQYATANRYDLVGPHHEIYLSDPRSTDAESLRTIVRYPCSRRRRRANRPPSVLGGPD